eukprot:5083655-Amphidinium_carterae.1
MVSEFRLSSVPVRAAPLPAPDIVTRREPSVALVKLEMAFMFWMMTMIMVRWPKPNFQPSTLPHRVGCRPCRLIGSRDTMTTLDIRQAQSTLDVLCGVIAISFLQRSYVQCNATSCSLCGGLVCVFFQSVLSGVDMLQVLPIQTIAKPSPASFRPNTSPSRRTDNLSDLGQVNAGPTEKLPVLGAEPEAEQLWMGARRLMDCSVYLLVDSSIVDMSRE